MQRPTMKFVATKTVEQLDLQALHRVRERLVSQRTGIINQIRAFLLERGVAVRQGQRFFRAERPRILATPPDVLSPRMVRIIESLASDLRLLDKRIQGLSGEIEELAKRDAGCERLMTVPGIGPIISSAMVAAIGTGDGFVKGRDFAAWLGLVPRQISTGDRTILGKKKPNSKNTTSITRRHRPAPSRRLNRSRFNSPGSLAKYAAMRRASSLVSRSGCSASVRLPVLKSFSKQRHRLTPALSNFGIN